MASLVAERFSQNEASASSFNCAVSGLTTGNHLIVLITVRAGSARSVSSVSDNQSGTWQQDEGLSATTTRNGIYAYSSKIGATPPTQVTVSMSAAQVTYIEILELTGLHPTTWKDVASSPLAQTTTTAFAVNAITPAASGEFCIAFCATNGVALTGFTPDSNYVTTGLSIPADTTTSDMCAQYRASSTTSENPGGTYSSSLNTSSQAVIVAYIPAPVTFTPQRPLLMTLSRSH